MKKDNCSRQIYLNTVKGFKLEGSTVFEEQIAEMEPTVMGTTTKDASISILMPVLPVAKQLTEAGGKLLKCKSCKLLQHIIPESKHQSVKLFVHNTNTQAKFDLTVFHQQVAKIFETTKNQLHVHLTDDNKMDILLETDALDIIYNFS